MVQAGPEMHSSTPGPQVKAALIDSLNSLAPRADGIALVRDSAAAGSAASAAEGAVGTGVARASSSGTAEAELSVHVNGVDGAAVVREPDIVESVSVAPMDDAAEGGKRKREAITWTLGGTKADAAAAAKVSSSYKLALLPAAKATYAAHLRLTYHPSSLSAQHDIILMQRPFHDWLGVTYDRCVMKWQPMEIGG